MTEAIHVLIVEDLPTDAELTEREIRKVLDPCRFMRVETREEYIVALEEFQPALIVSDFKLPRFDGLSALNLALERCPDVPFIIVTGSMNEDTAVDCMKAGAWDYVIKEHVKRLGSAIEGALDRQRLWKKRKQAERELEASEMRYRRLFQAAKDGILIVDADSGKIVDVNPFLIELTGYSHQEFLGEHVWEIGPFKDVATSREEFGKLRSEHYVRYEDLPLQTRDGRSIDVEFVSNVYSVAGKDVIQCNIRDVTERKRAERRDQERRATLNAVMESSDSPIFAVDRAFCYTGFNRAHANVVKALYGVDVQLGAKIAEPQTVSEEWEIVKKNLERGLQGETVFESAAMGDEGKSRRYFEVTYNPVRTDAGDIVGASVFARDVTQRKRMDLEREQLERQLRVSQKMEAIGSVASGVAHDFNNLLSVILSYTGMALDDSKYDDDLHEGLLEVRHAANRAAALTRQLLAFSRNQVLRPVTLNLNEIAAGVERMLRRVLRENIEFALVLAPDLGMTVADPGQIEQVLMNLVVNARDAMPDGGSITIETSNVRLDEEYAESQFDVIPGSYVQFLVRDTGHGMDEQTRARIFEPFFTTKDKDKGTGLGLSTVYGIVKQSNGNIWVDSVPGQGTTFRICLPRDFMGTATRTGPPMAIRRRRGSETILVVDDDETVRNVACKTLEKVGYTVLCAEGRDEALQIFTRHSGKVQLLLTDVVMPYMSGLVLADDLLKLRPSIKILYMSGYTENAVVCDGVVGAGVQFIAKPFTSGELMAKVREVLDSGASDDSDGQLRVAKAEGDSRAHGFDPDALRALPQDVLDRLLDAVIRTRHDELVELLETIGTTNPELANGLRRMADNFEYEALRGYLGR
jgi:two-component system, cell cycle sensor histidine kinase and response regulator CckA